MHIRLLFASPDGASLALLQSIHDSAINLMCFTTSTATASNREALFARVDEAMDDVILLDWPMAEAGTPDLVKELLAVNPKLRVVVLLPMNYRQYRQQVWNAGACNSIPKEYMEQEWFSSIICVMHRAMEREERLRAEYEGRVMPVSECRLSEVQYVKREE